MRWTIDYRYSFIGGLALGAFYAWHLVMAALLAAGVARSLNPGAALIAQGGLLLPIWAAGAVIFGSIALFGRRPVVASEEAPPRREDPRL